MAAINSCCMQNTVDFCTFIVEKFKSRATQRNQNGVKSNRNERVRKDAKNNNKVNNNGSSSNKAAAAMRRAGEWKCVSDRQRERVRQRYMCERAVARRVYVRLPG